MSELIISVSGLRGIVGETLNPQAAIRYVSAYAAELRAGPVVVGLDGRRTGRVYADLVSGALRALGHSVCDAGIVATPTLGVLVRQHHAVGGIQVSASHNPPEYNGLKLFDAKGSVLNATLGQHVLARYAAGEANWVRYDKVGTSQLLEDPHGEHLRLVSGLIDVDRIRSKKYKVLLDSNHGAGSGLGRKLLQALGCEVLQEGGVPDGDFQHPPEPLLENLSAICKRVAEAQVDVGFCQDPDADRLAVVDEKGRYLGEEYTLALCTDHILRQTPGPIVTNCATSRMCEDLAGKYGVPFYRSAVGEANVVQMMRAQDAVFGGEGNGGPIDPRVGYVRDSFVGMALVLDAMAARQATVSQLAAELPRYEIFKRKVSLPAEKMAAVFDALERHFSDATASRMDGLRLDWPDQWLLIRGSNTEPIARVIAEAKSQDMAVRKSLETIKVLASVH